MSYDIVRSMSVNLKDKKQTFSVASSNVTPKTFEKVEIKGYQDGLNDSRFDMLTEEEKLVYYLVQDLSGGMLQLNKSVSVKYRYATQKMFEKRNEIYLANKEIFTDSWGGHPWNVMKEEVQGKCNLHNIREVIQAFLQALETKDIKINKVIEFEHGYVLKRTPSNLKYTGYEGHAKVYKSQKAIELDMVDLSSSFTGYEFKGKELQVV